MKSAPLMILLLLRAKKNSVSRSLRAEEKLADKLAGVASKVADSVVLKLAERGQKPIV